MKEIVVKRGSLFKNSKVQELIALASSLMFELNRIVMFKFQVNTLCFALPVQIMDHGPPLSWDDIAGLEFAKTVIKEIVVWPMLRP